MKKVKDFLNACDNIIVKGEGWEANLNTNLLEKHVVFSLFEKQEKDGKKEKVLILYVKD